MHKGIKSLLLGLGLLFTGIFLIIGLYFLGDTTWGKANSYWIFLIGAFALILALAGPATIVLSTKDIFQWIGEKFGLRLLALFILLLALTMTALTAFAVLASMEERRLHTHLIVGMFTATGALWAYLFSLKSKIFDLPEVRDELT